MAELDIGQLADRLAVAGVSDLQPLPGGASSLTFAGRMAGRPVVVKVAPPGLPPVLNRDVLRQARMIRALQKTTVPVPEILWEEPGQPPAVPPLFVMSFLEGSSREPLFDLEGEDVDGSTIAGRLRNAATAMAELHRLDPDSLALGDEPVVGPGEEIDRWCRLLSTVDTTLVPRWEEAADGLRAGLPAPLRPSIVHGDFRLGNLLALDERITAVIDWEIWSIGDPRVDAGWFLLNADPDTYRRPTPFVGATPPPAELVVRYEEALGHDVPDLGWFVALASFKSAATWSLIVKHNRRRSTPDPELETMAPGLGRLLERTTQLLG
jgi:aminoglycoside phosphotransferase (APT) family kinase protein